MASAGGSSGSLSGCDSGSVPDLFVFPMTAVDSAEAVCGWHGVAVRLEGCCGRKVTSSATWDCIAVDSDRVSELPTIKVWNNQSGRWEARSVVSKSVFPLNLC